MYCRDIASRGQVQCHLRATSRQGTVADGCIPSRPKLLPTDFLFWGIIWASVMGYRTEKIPAQNYLDR